MELKIDLSVNADITYVDELDAVSKWNIEKPDNQIYYINGYLETYKGNLDIVSENWSISHSYLYNNNPTIKPYVFLVIDGNVVICDSDTLDILIGESKSVIIGLMLYAETLSLSKPKEDFSWIKVKQFDESKYATIEEKYLALQKHHQEEVGFLIDFINKNCNK